MPIALATGALIGLAALTRSEALLLVPLLAWPVAYRAGPGWPLRAAAATAACVLVIAPWTIRNLVQYERLVPISNNDSTVIAGANCDLTYRGVNMGGWDIRCISERRLDDEAAQARIWRDEGLDYARDHAGRLPAVAAVRLLRVWDLWQPRRQVMFAEGRELRVTRVGLVVYFLLCALAIGGALALRRRGRPLLILLAPARRGLHRGAGRLRRAAAAARVRDPADGARRGGHRGGARAPGRAQAGAGVIAGFGRRLALIAVAALGIRLLYALVLVRDAPLLGDALQFHLQANYLADGLGYVQPFLLRDTGVAQASADKPPLFPFLEAGVSLLGGRSWAWHHLVGVLAGTGTVVVCGLLGRKVAGPAVGLGAAALAAVYPVLVATDGSLRSESVYALAIALVLLAALRLREAPSAGRRGAARRGGRRRGARPQRGARPARAARAAAGRPAADGRSRAWRARSC